MKERELRERCTCAMCGKKIGATGLPMFWTVEIKRYVIDLAAAQRQQALGLMLGGALAMHMGPDEDMAKEFGEPATLTVCAHCVADPTCVAVLADMGSNPQQTRQPEIATTTGVTIMRGTMK
jgi:hypothetical protein